MTTIRHISNNGGNIFTVKKDNVVDFAAYRQRLDERKKELAGQKRNREINLCMGVDIDYLEKLRQEAGLFITILANKLGVTASDLREYISYNKACPLSFAQNWELTLLLGVSS